MKVRRLTMYALVVLLAAVPACSDHNPTDPDPLVFVFQKQKDPTEIQRSADQVAAYLQQKLGVTVQTYVPTSYAGSVQGLASKTVDIAYVSSIPFLLAKQKAGAELLLAEQRVDRSGTPRTDYDSVLVVKQDSPLQTIEDLVAKAPQIRMVFTSPHSTSGYVMAYWRLVQEGLLEPGQDPDEVFDTAVFAGSYTLALQQVLNGWADVCAVSYYTVEGSSAKKYLKPEQLQQLRVLARTPGVPTHLICIRSDLNSDLKLRIKNALLNLSNDHPNLLEDVYGAKKLVNVDPDLHVAKAVEAAQYLQHLGVSLEQLVSESIPPKEKG